MAKDAAAEARAYAAAHADAATTSQDELHAANDAAARAQAHAAAAQDDLNRARADAAAHAEVAAQAQEELRVAKDAAAAAAAEAQEIALQVGFSRPTPLPALSLSFLAMLRGIRMGSTSRCDLRHRRPQGQGKPRLYTNKPSAPPCIVPKQPIQPICLSSHLLRFLPDCHTDACAVAPLAPSRSRSPYVSLSYIHTYPCTHSQQYDTI